MPALWGAEICPRIGLFVWWGASADGQGHLLLRGDRSECRGRWWRATTKRAKPQPYLFQGFSIMGGKLVAGWVGQPKVQKMLGEWVCAWGKVFPGGGVTK